MELLIQCEIFYQLCKEADRRSDREMVVLPESLDILAKFVNSGYYIHFSDHRDLVGINPNYVGPNLQGIFTFYLDEAMFTRIATGSSGIKSSRPFIQIIAPNPGKILDSATYSESDLAKNLSQLGVASTTKGIPAKILMSAISALAPTSNSAQNKFLQSLGYIGITDHGDGVLFSSKAPGQTVFLAKKYITVVDTVDNPLKTVEKSLDKTQRSITL